MLMKVITAVLVVLSLSMGIAKAREVVVAEQSVNQPINRQKLPSTYCNDQGLIWYVPNMYDTIRLPLPKPGHYFVDAIGNGQKFVDAKGIFVNVTDDMWKSDINAASKQPNTYRVLFVNEDGKLDSTMNLDDHYAYVFCVNPNAIQLPHIDDKFGLKYEQAKEYCQIMGTRLIDPRRDDVYSPDNHTPMWIGVTLDPNDNSRFIDSNGVSIPTQMVGNWRSGEPNDPNKEKCVIIFKGELFDVPCWITHAEIDSVSRAIRARCIE